MQQVCLEQKSIQKQGFLQLEKMSQNYLILSREISPQIRILEMQSQI